MRMQIFTIVVNLNSFRREGKKSKNEEEVGLEKEEEKRGERGGNGGKLMPRFNSTSPFLCQDRADRKKKIIESEFSFFRLVLHILSYQL